MTVEISKIRVTACMHVCIVFMHVSMYNMSIYVSMYNMSRYVCIFVCISMHVHMYVSCMYVYTV